MIPPGRPGCHHRARRGLGAEKRPLQVDVHDDVPVSLGQLQKRHAREHAGVVDQDVDPAKT